MFKNELTTLKRANKKIFRSLRVYMIQKERIKATNNPFLWSDRLESKVLAEPVLVGREQELAELQRYLELAKEGKGTTVFVSGEAGSGKTRLISEFLDLVKKENVLILAGWCLSNAAQPYFPFVEAFESYSPTVGSSLAQQQELKSWLVGHGQAEGTEITPQVWKDQTFASITKELLYMSTNKPIILFIDDLHWADSASLALLHYIARAIISERLLIIATFRSEEITAKLEGHMHPLAEVLRLMAREGLFAEIKLQNLHKDSVGKIAENMLGGSLDPNFVSRLLEESHGNPLFVVEALRMIYSQGGLLREHDQWCLTDRSIGIPEKVKDVIMRRIDLLKPNQRRIMNAASVIGEKFDPKLIAELLSRDSIKVLEDLDDIAKSTLLVFCDGNEYQFKHAKIQEMVYDQIPLPLKIEYHSRIAVIIEGKSQNVEPFPSDDLAYHFVQAGNRRKAIKYSLQAGNTALVRFSNLQAIQHFTYVVKATENDKELINERISALEGLGEAFYANSMLEEAIEIFERLSDVGTEAVRLRALRKAMDSAFQCGDRQRLTELLKKTEQYVAADRLENARVLFAKGLTFALQTNMPAAIENYEAALKVFQEEYSLWDTGAALIGLGGCQAKSGMLKQGIAKCLCAIALAEELCIFHSQMDACYTTGFTFGDCLLEDEALVMFAKVNEIDEKMKMNDYLRLFFANALSSKLFEQKGDLKEALSFSLKALKLAQKTESTTAHGVIYSILTRQYARLGDEKLSDKYFEKFMKLPPEIFSNPYVEASLAEAVFNVGQGKFEESNQKFKRYLETLTHGLGGLDGYIIRAKLDYAWALKKQGLLEEAKAEVDDVQRMRLEAKERFEHVDLQPNLMARRQICVGEELEIRLYLVNVAKTSGKLLRVEGLIPLNSKLTSMPSYCKVKSNSIEMNEKEISPFQVETIKLNVIFTEDRVYKLEPSVFYLDDLGKIRKTKAEAVTITAQLKPLKGKREDVAEPVQDKIEFKFEAAEKAFNFLVSAFKEDYVGRRLPLEKSGWRTLMEIAKKAEITTYSMYGRYGQGGKAAWELEHLGLVESRFFLGERGRGGRVIKLRICCEKEYVKRRIGVLR
jgi:tetratricopeptide (TPR) repeat protein